MNSILTRYQVMIERAAAAGRPDKSKTLSAWHQRACNTRAALMTVKAENEKRLEELRATYQPAKFEEKRQDLDDAYNAVRAYSIQKVVDDLNNILHGKRTQLDKKLDAPTAEQLRLLQTLDMRTALTVADIAAISGRFNNNIPALQALRDIAAKHDVYFPDFSAETYETQLERAKQFCNDMLQVMGVDVDNMNYRQRLFWTAPGEGEDRAIFGPLDAEGFTAQQIETSTEQAKREAQAAVQASNSDSPAEMWLRLKCRGTEDAVALADQFHITQQELRNANPGKDLSRLYAGDVLYIPSTNMRNASGAVRTAQLDQVELIPRPIPTVQLGPGGELPGEDITLV